MSIQFNGQVIINGNVEMFDNGSMKITSNEININISELSDFIEKTLPYSVNKETYKEAANTLQNSTDKNKIKDALKKFEQMGRELTKGIWINGLSQVVIEAIKELFK